MRYRRRVPATASPSRLTAFVALGRSHLGVPPETVEQAPHTDPGVRDHVRVSFDLAVYPTGVAGACACARRCTP